MNKLTLALLATATALAIAPAAMADSFTFTFTTYESQGASASGTLSGTETSTVGGYAVYTVTAGNITFDSDYPGYISPSIAGSLNTGDTNSLTATSNQFHYGADLNFQADDPTYDNLYDISITGNGTPGEYTLSVALASNPSDVLFTEGTDLDTSDVTPEPSSLVLLGTGLLGLAFVAFRKAKSTGMALSM